MWRGAKSSICSPERASSASKRSPAARRSACLWTVPRIPSVLCRRISRRCGLAARVLQCDALGILKSGEKFDLIFLDPPYGSGLEAKAIETVKEFDILSRGGIMVVETRPETALPVLPPEYGTTKTYRYGKIKLTVITRGNN